MTVKCPHCGKIIKQTSGIHGTPCNLRQWKFAVAYARNGGNGTQAAREAGYNGSDNTLAQTASKLVRLPKVKAVVERWIRPLDDISEDAIREIMQDPDDKHARLRATWLDSKIRGKIAPTRVEHKHAHVHLQLPSASTPEGVDATVRSIRALLGRLPPPERARLLDDCRAVVIDIPELPEVVRALPEHSVGRRDGEGAEAAGA